MTAEPKPRSWQLKLAFVWGGELFSLLTSSVLQMGLIWHITMTTGSGSMLSLASLAGFLPLAFLGPIAGVVVDRLSVKPVLIGADLFIAAVSAVVALVSLTGALPVWVVILALFVRSLGSAFYAPAAASLTPLIAPPEHLTRLAGIQQSAQSLGYIAGTAIAAVIYPTLGLTAMIALDVVGALIASAAVVLSRIETPRMGAAAGGENMLVDELEGAPEQASAAQAHPVRAILAEFAQGYQELKSHRGLFALLWCGFAFTLVLAPITALYPLMAIGHFGGGTTEAAIVEVVFAVGMIAGGGLLAATGGFKNRATSIVASTALHGAACVAAGLLGPDGFVPYVFCAFAMGLSAPWYSGPQTALMQEKVAPEFLGRVFGLYGGIMSWAMPVGLVFSTVLADATGAPLWFLGAGLVMVVLAGVTAAIPAVRNIERE